MYWTFASASGVGGVHWGASAVGRSMVFALLAFAPSTRRSLIRTPAVAAVA
ncbi:hypothetical protein [Saccharopolyspora spinosa]|uniref:hypothetical protein n=1 Tax=Saccharopolyspora spinosa TaxID=60894 RepID=UPI003B42D543